MHKTLKTLLIADDCRIARQVMRLYLRRDYETLEAESGSSALEILRKKRGRIDGILIDPRLKGADGKAVVDVLKESDSFGNLPVVAVTVRGDTGAKAKCRRLGLRERVDKPINAALLLDAVDRVLTHVEPIRAITRRKGEGR